MSNFHPCKCTDYNGGQCYNCINGAHDICDAVKGCRCKRAKRPGVMLCFKPKKLKTKSP